MAILKIARMGHPVLRTPARPVEEPRDPALRRLVGDMIETLYDAGGTGLAAPQVHVSARVLVYFVGAERARAEAAVQAEGEDGEASGTRDTGPVPLTVLVNPTLEPLDEGLEDGLEGCLSIPDLAGLVPRHRAVRYRAVGLDGNPLEGVARGFHARVLQHECDHLDGVLYPQRMRDLGSLTFTDQLSAAATGEAARAALAEVLPEAENAESPARTPESLEVRP